MKWASRAVRAAFAISMVAGLLVPAASANASGEGCHPVTLGSYQVCIHVYGTGLTITQVQTWGMVAKQTPALFYVSLTNPASKIIATGAAQSAPYASSTITGPTWSPNAVEPAGNYCANLYTGSPPAHGTPLETACLSVHA